MAGKDILDAAKLVKEYVQCLLEWGTTSQPQQDHIWKGGGEPRNEKKLWNGKLIGRLLLTVTVEDPERFTLKRKPVTYTGVFVEFYNGKNCDQVHEIELEKMRALTAENLHNLNTHQIIDISLFLRSTHVLPGN